MLFSVLDHIEYLFKHPQRVGFFVLPAYDLVKEAGM